MSITIHPVAKIRTEFPQKFGIPRQPLLAKETVAEIVFEPDYRNPDCIRGMGQCSHLWLIWEFTEFTGRQWSPLVRPPRLGGNRKMGVFATRSPLRPNSLGLSVVKILEIVNDRALGPIIRVSGADMMDGTPIYDIKPYIPYADSIQDAVSEIFTQPETLSSVRWGCDSPLPHSDRRIAALEEVLLQDPRPAYKHNDSGSYAFEFAGLHVEFCVEGDVAVVTVCEPLTSSLT
ncbi:MAG: tRNA (N6-threonylcarbamoyladenosine(37)-N6)-methyltransferase TrmO [Bacteroidales bacterium]|nr:tRNA (N6-threonylcarbamoyladenosine(37)-N6)-methyltransferase TrmO [Bacteroidales bacterium]